MPNVFSSLFRRAGRRKIYADLLQLDDRLLKDIGVTRSDIRSLTADRGQKSARWHE